MMKTDIEIAQECTMEPITEVAERAVSGFFDGKRHLEDT